MPNRSRTWLFALVALTLLACSLGGGGAPPGSQGPGTQPTETATTEPEEPLPLSLSEAVAYGVASDRWTEAEGIATGLRYLSGELSLEGAVGDQPILEPEGTGLMRMAQRYLDDASNLEGREEIERLVSILVPSRQTLDRISRPSAAGSGPGLAHGSLRPAGDAAECRALWSTGFDTEEPITCLEYAERTLNGNTYRVYYPAYWQEEADPRLDLHEPTLEALVDSIRTFNAYGPQPVVGTDMVFTDLDALDDDGLRDDTILAAADRTLYENRCHVAIFPSAGDLGAEGEGDGFGGFQQTVAHELFHCYQYTNLHPEESGPPDTVNEWWVEGSAEFFGSVVYPTVNDEFRFLPALDRRSVAHPLVDFSYASYAFFQYLAVQAGMGDSGVIEVLRQMPESGGLEEQQQALAGISGIQQAFHEFGQAYLDKQLQDLGGGVLPLHPDEGQNAAFGIGEGEGFFGPEAFVLRRYRMSFAQNARFTIVQETEGEGRHSARPASATGAWAPVPAELDAACGESEYVLLVTSAIPPSGEVYNLTLHTVGEEVDEEQPCEECLVGTWELDNSTYLAYSARLWDYLVSAMAPDAESHPTGVTGRLALTFRDDGTASGVQEGFGMSGETTREGKTVHMSISYSGTGSASWKVQEDYLLFEDGAFDLTAYISFEGMPLAPRPTGGSNTEVFLSAPATYTCERDTLLYTVIPEFGAVRFVRSRGDEVEP